MDHLPQEIQDVTVLRRIIFAVAYLPKEFPHYWLVVSEFANRACKSTNILQPDVVRLAVENLQYVNEKAFVLDKELAQEIHGFTSPTAPYSLGIVLVSSNDTCRLCGSRLLVRNERTSHITIYTEAYGTIVGTHYHKYCQKFRKGCPFRQYYGYSSEGNQSVVFYDANWAQHKYFVSSSETAFELEMLKRFDAELLIGQISYNQKAEIYNYFNAYPVQPKKCSKQEEDDVTVSCSSRFVMVQNYMYIQLKHLHCVHSTPEELHHRIRLDRRRLESAHLKFAVLTTQSHYPNMWLGPVCVHTDLSKTLVEFTVTYYKAFTHKYSGLLTHTYRQQSQWLRKIEIRVHGFEK